MYNIPASWKVAEARQTTNRCYMLLLISKLFEKMRLKPLIENINIIPDYEFGFRPNHLTIDQVHRITDVIKRAPKEKVVCSEVLLDITQAFNKVWHADLVHTLSSNNT